APLLDVVGVARLKEAVLHRCFDRFPWDAGSRAAFERFRRLGGEALQAHALFEALSASMVAGGSGAGWPAWPAELRTRQIPEVAGFAARERARIDYELWLQWQADLQLALVQERARAAGMRIGLCLDLAVGAASDGSATWTEPNLTVPELSIGAPPDAFNADGQDWGLAPLSPVALVREEGRPFSEMLAAVLRRAGAVRIDHVMNLARLWLVPRGRSARDGAYMRFPLRLLLARLAEESQGAQAMILGEDLGTVPEGFRALMSARRLHGYRVFYFERTSRGFRSPRRWPTDGIACVGTHDMPTFTGWWRALDLDLRRDLGLLNDEGWQEASSAREKDRGSLRKLLGTSDDPAELSPRLHAYLAASRCRLMAMQLEDALGVAEQINLPGTVDAYPNWRHRLPVPVESIAEHPGFRAHAEGLRAVRPR
ncbi:MAG TPA: 4-alpha-glucanotransferase, partial [Kiloniellales bacterium]|nr:4-alpha-glucanotransferase [Kiloniellales bacterium]